VSDAGRSEKRLHVFAHGIQADFVRAHDGRLVELWPVQESLPLLEGLGAVVRVSAEG
jgi:hypothetical protein